MTKPGEMELKVHKPLKVSPPGGVFHQQVCCRLTLNQAWTTAPSCGREWYYTQYGWLSWSLFNMKVIAHLLKFKVLELFDRN